MLTLSAGDFLPSALFLEKRPLHVKRLKAIRASRRLHVGPYAVFLFENRDTLWWQIQEMLRIEQGGEEQLADELAAYTPMLPQGSDWVATLMFEIPDSTRRRTLLQQWGHIEKHIHLHIGQERVMATPVGDDERTTPDGKTSAVHFLRFHFSASQKNLLMHEAAHTMLSLQLHITHPAYTHSASLTESTHKALRQDLT